MKAGKVYDTTMVRQEFCDLHEAFQVSLFIEGKGYNCLIKNPVILLNVLDEKKMQ